jgi:hypothetical protein
VRSASWREIQALRAEPTGKAASDRDRKRTFRSAPRQAEELAEAADIVSYAAKPILLFYALSQASQALGAAKTPHPWTLHSHGLECRSAGADILRATVEPYEGTQTVFQAVTAAVDSPALVGKAQLGALWAANPDVISVPIRPDLGQWPAALSYDLGTRRVRGGNGGPSDPERVPTTTGGIVFTAVRIPGDTGEQVAQVLDAYPTLTGATALTPDPPNADRYAGPAEPIVRSPTGPDGHLGVVVAKDAPRQMSLAEYWQLQDSLYSVVEIDQRLPVPPYPNLIGYALPAVAGGPSPLPLVLWWALLLGLSSLARYESAAWAAAIDLDASPLAADLRTVLDIAAERVPARILDSLQAASDS